MEWLVHFDNKDSKYVMDGFVIYPGRKLFEAGHWPKKNNGKGFKATEEDLDAFVVNFNNRANPVPLDMEHRPTVIKDDELGHVQNMFTGVVNGRKQLFGDIAIPSWLDPHLKPETCLSVTIDEKNNSIVKTALLLNPEIKDAKLLEAQYLAAFATFAETRHDTHEGRSVIQSIHDQAARAGAICKAPEDEGSVEMHSQHESDAIQEIHDTACTHGAKCHYVDPDAEVYAWFGEENSMKPEEVEQKVESGMLNALKSFFGVQQTTPQTTSPSPPAVQFAQTPAQVPPPQGQPEKSEREIQLEKEIAELRRGQAVQFAEDLFKQKLILPAEKDAVVNSYVQFAEDDAANPKEITFGEKEKGSRVDAYKASFKSRQPHTLSEEAVQQGEENQYRVLFGATNEAPDSWGDTLAQTTKNIYGSS